MLYLDGGQEREMEEREGDKERDMQTGKRTQSETEKGEREIEEREGQIDKTKNREREKRKSGREERELHGRKKRNREGEERKGDKYIDRVWREI